MIGENRSLYIFYFAVTPKKEDVLLAGITDDYIEVGTDLDLMCTISRIKPAAAEMYWVIGGQRQRIGRTDRSEC